MKRRAALLGSFVAVVAPAFGAAPATAVAPPDPCPDGFVASPSAISPPGTDKNGNGIVCAKPADGQIVFVDDSAV